MSGSGRRPYCGRRTGPVTDPVHQRLIRAAHWHADRGLAVFPLAPGRKVPAVDKDWEAAATLDHRTINRLWLQAPYNIGVATGRSGLLVVDLDRPRTPSETAPPSLAGLADGRAVLESLAAQHEPLPATWTVTTASGGTHLYFRQPAGQQLGNTAGRLGWKIDTRGCGGYVVAAGSVVAANRYIVHIIRTPAPLPDWISTALAPAPTPAGSSSVKPAVLHNATAYGLAALASELDTLLATAPGSRNHQLNKAAFALGRLLPSGALHQSRVHGELITAAHQIGLGAGEAERTIASGLQAGLRNPRCV
ncbi:bifunctional DNA primase/polymerase [Kribbella sp. NPDC056951]|uniref:bifunctional DNA primase/polymerase n=1 Tax=Kribbella sp. NPDC056951 TaxID=3345978 RepID=UPI00362845E9